MSTTFRVQIGPHAPRSTVDAGLPDLRWEGGEEPSDPLIPGRWGMFRDRLSTRLTTVTYDGTFVSVRLQSGSCTEDCDLALDVVRRAASGGTGLIEADSGQMALPDFERLFDGRWKQQQLAAARIVIQMAEERGPMEMPGPTRGVSIGPRSVVELRTGPDDGIGDRLVTLMRRVLWPDPRYESAGRFTASTPDGERVSLAILLPDRACVLPATKRLAIEDAEGVFTIPRAALADLPVRTTDLDDGNQLMEPVALDDWPNLCRRARAHQLA